MTDLAALTARVEKVLGSFVNSGGTGTIIGDLIRDLLTYATTVSQERDGWKFQLDGLEQIRLRENEYLIARAEQAEQERDAAIARAERAEQRAAYLEGYREGAKP